MTWIHLVIVLAVFLIMEFVAWALHKFVMHGFLWHLHEDHHVKEPGFFEKNDAFFLVFAIPSFLFFLFGTIYTLPILISVAAGVTLYGLAYFLVHEVFIHQRFKWFRNSNNIYFRSVLLAHKMHHKHLGKHEGESFGMLIIHPKYYRQQLQLEIKKRAKAKMS